MTLKDVSKRAIYFLVASYKSATMAENFSQRDQNLKKNKYYVSLSFAKLSLS